MSTSFKRATQQAHILIGQALKPGVWAVDATVGNGHDTLFLAECVGVKGRVFGFDIQKAALAATAERLGEMPQITLIHAGHETLSAQLQAQCPAGKPARLAGVMFNLGYLPGAPKNIITKTETTLAALEQALNHLAVTGLITLVLYPGHPGGAVEADAVRAYAETLGPAFAVTRYARENTAHPAPELLAIKRLSQGLDPGSHPKGLDPGSRSRGLTA